MLWWLFKIGLLLFLISWALSSYIKNQFTTPNKENYGGGGRNNGGDRSGGTYSSNTNPPSSEAGSASSSPTHTYEMEQNDFVTGKSTYTEYLAKQQKSNRSP
jgi:hypothetical protein